MATADLNKLQQILANAEDNDAILTQIRKHVAKVNELMAELNSMLDPEYKVEKKERKPRAVSATGKRPGRPKKNVSAE
jgi:flagellar capping protein FliD